jgi:hypothetical protein
MRKPSLTKRILHGLSMMAGVIEAGTCGDALGIAEEDLDKQGKIDWNDITRACAWVRKMQAAKEPE